MERLRDLDIRRKDVIATYANEPELFAKYLQIKALLDERYSPEEIHQLVYGSNAFNIRQNDEQDMKPLSLKGVEALEQKNLLPLNINNPVLPLLSLLVSANFWRGTRSNIKDATSSTNHISLLNEEQEKIVIRILNALDVEWKKYDDVRNSKKSSGIALWRTLGRLIDLMGLSAGRKSEGILFPDYIKSSLNSLQDLSAPEKERFVAYNILHDFILSLLFFRAKFHPSGRPFCNLTSFKKKKHVEGQADLIEPAVKATFPGLDFNLSKMSTDRKSYRYRLYFSGSQANKKAIDAHYHQRVDEVIAQSRLAVAETKK